MTLKRINSKYALFFFLLMLQACGTNSIKPAYFDVDTRTVLNGEALLGDVANTISLPQLAILELDTDMKDFVDTYVPRHTSTSAKINMLVAAIFTPGIGGVKYSFGKTMTARETFHKSNGNCLSFSHMFVAMARYAGLKARYQEVKVPPSWTAMEGDESFLFTRHVNVNIKLDKFGSSVTVDINAPEDVDYRHGKKLSDNEAFAQHFNNIAVDYMFAEDKVNAFRYFKKAILLSPHDDAAWVNLGTLYRRNGLKKYAEIAYLHALRLNEDKYTTNSNLAYLYEATGDREKYNYYLNKIEYIRKKNPYFRYFMAKKDFDIGNYLSAEKHLVNAMKEIKDDKRFYQLMVSIQHKLKNENEANKYLAIAESLPKASRRPMQLNLNRN